MEQNNQSIAQTVIFSSLLTLGIVCSVLYVARVELAEYVVQQSQGAPLAELETALATEEQVVQSIEAVNPAVVSVIVTKDVPTYEQYYETYDQWGPFGGFQVPRVRENGTEEREVGGGSGFIVDGDGMIVTNRHVVSDTEARYSVLLNDGMSYEVEVLARDPQLDIAILQISEPIERELEYVEFGDSESLRLGETVIAIGNALAEFQNSVSVGVVSGLSRSIVASDSMGRSEQLDQVIQTDTAINPGNSGGPLLNIYGEVIGVNVATSRGADNIGFALPAHVVKLVVDSVREHGEIIRPFLGVRYMMLNPRMVEQREMEVEFGALVISGANPADVAVLAGSPADVAGITENTIILSIDGEELRERDLASVLRTKQVGEEVELELYQAGEYRTVSVVLSETS